METTLLKRRKIAIPTRMVTVEEYLALEEQSDEKHEFHNGSIRAMAGGKLAHNQLAQKAAYLIDSFLEEHNIDYIFSNSDTKIRIETYNKFVYPDAVVICEKPEFYKNRKDTITNPLLIVEVLSDSTDSYDRGLKYEYYRTLSSFKEYVLIHQDRKRVSVYSKQADNTWVIRDYEGDNAVAVLYGIEQCPFSLKRLYRGVKMTG